MTTVLNTDELTKIACRGGHLWAGEDTAKRLAEIRAFAVERGIRDHLEQRLGYLATYGEKTKCVLYHDFAFMSLTFVMHRRNDHGQYDYRFNGGFIYDGPGTPCDGSAPQLTVSLGKTPAQGQWGIHT